MKTTFWTKNRVAITIAIGIVVMVGIIGHALFFLEGGLFKGLF